MSPTKKEKPKTQVRNRYLGHPAARHSRLVGFGEAEDDSGAETEIVLAVVQAVGEFGEEVLGLEGANRDDSGHLDIQATADGHGENVDWARLSDSRSCHDASEEDLREWSDSVAAEIDARSEYVRERPGKGSSFYYLIAA